MTRQELEIHLIKTKEALKKFDTQDKCVVCLESVRTVVFIQCKHLCCCS